jgi:predicted permease
MSNLVQDVRYTIRQWTRTPVFTIVAILTIGVGSAGVTAMLSVTDTLLFRGEPGIRDPKGLVEVRVANRGGGSPHLMPFSTFDALRKADVGIDELAAGSQFPASISVGGSSGPEMVAGVTVTANYFSVVGARPALGRFFSEEEGLPGGGQPVVVLSHRFWVRSFGRDPGVLGTSVVINRRSFVIIGVAEEGFHGHLPLYDYSLFVPMALRESLAGGSLPESRVATVGRLARGSSPERVRVSTAALVEELRGVSPADWVSSTFVVEPHTESYQEIRGPLSLFLGFLLALSACVLLIACANIASLLLSRALARAHEMALRRAIGAGRRRLVSQLLVETLLMLAAGCGVGFVLAFGITEWLGGIDITLDAPLMGEYGPDGRVLLVSWVLTAVVGTAFGLAPALKAAGTDLASVLRDQQGQGPGRNRIRKAFVVVQVAASVVLLVGSGLLFQAISKAESMDLGFDPEGVHVATVNLEIQKYSEEEGRIFFGNLLQRAERLPGVRSAALTDFVSLASPPQRGGRLSNPEGGGEAFGGIFSVSPGYFLTSGTEIQRGRPFDRGDDRSGEPVAIINRKASEMLWPGEEAVGKTIEIEGEPSTVVGVAENAKYISIGESPLVAVFRPQAQLYAATNSLLLKVDPPGGDMPRKIQEMVRSLDPDIPLSANETQARLLRNQLIPRRLAGLFAGVLGAMGVFLAAVGLFGVLASMVTHKSPELAIRMALGASPGTVRRSVLRQGLGLVALGLCTGLPLSVMTSITIRGFLFGLDPMNPATLFGSGLLMTAVGFLASYLPALRATRLDPSRVLQRV